MAQNLESTATLLAKVRAGDLEARDYLFKLYLPMLQKWAHGRLPPYVRDLSETADMVQNTLLSAMNKIDSFQPHREGAFVAYLRTCLLNNIRMEIRRFKSKKDKTQLPDTEPVDPNTANALEQAIGMEAVENYEQALMSLPDNAKEAVILRIEFGYSYPEISAALSCSSANHARMVVTRAIYKLTQHMS
ncbi:MAG: sigma-70 family RNA polymerase sigma factor [Proteobacteria bacterium]|nr:MAG: sigma-70 family RNA polymerase sigma factor [Pseudomonadota bacterium]